jgi:hypothetical protein
MRPVGFLSLMVLGSVLAVACDARRYSLGRPSSPTQGGSAGAWSGTAGVDSGGAGTGATSGEGGAPAEAGAGQGASSGEGGAPADAGAGQGASSGEAGATAGVSGSGGNTGGSGGTTGELVPYFHAGTRLKPMVVAAGPDVDVIEGWFDTELDIECFFLPDESGVERCFPLALLGGHRYADANCTQPVTLRSTPMACSAQRRPHRYVVDENFGADGCGHRGFRVGDELPVETPLFISDNGTCELYPFPEPSDSHVFALEALPPETFVGMQRVRRERAPGMDAVVREGEDGSWQVVDFFDPKRGAVCRDYRHLLVPHSKCIPVSIGSYGKFSDATCETEVVPARSCRRDTPTAIMESEYVPDSCPSVQSFQLFEIAETLDTEIFESEAGACVATGSRSNAYLQGAPIDVATLPTTTLMETGNGPVQGRFFGFGGIPFIPAQFAQPFVDAASGEDCHPYDFADGALRCVPSSFAAPLLENLYYEGSTCDGARLHLWTACPGTPEPRGLVHIEVGNCDEVVVTGTFALSGKSSASVASYVNETTGNCVSFATAEVTAPFFLLGESLNPAEEFPAVERVTRD